MEIPVMKLFNRPLGLSLSAAMLLGVAAPQSADACWWLFQKKATTSVAVEAPAPGPLPEIVTAPTPGPREECAIENKNLAGTVTKSNRRWVEAVYETRNRQQYS